VGSETPEHEDERSVSRTRGGWIPAGTSAARRRSQGARTTRKGAQRKEELVSAARRVFERGGYFNARVADIVAEAGIAHGSFYTYFASKQDVFLSVVHDVGLKLDEAVAASMRSFDGDPYETLDRSIRAYLDVYRDSALMLALVEQVATVEPDIHRIRLKARRLHVDRVAGLIERWQHQDPTKTDLDPSTLAGALVSMLSNFSYWWLAGGDSYDPETAARTLVEIWSRAVGLNGASEG
jgi:AcrR family transcriptional regulator